MSAAARIVVLGFDAMDPATVRAMAQAGSLPTFHRVLASGTSARIDNPYGFFISNTWTSLLTGLSSARTRFHSSDEIEAGTYRHRVTPFEQLRGAPFWRAVDAAGRRVAVVDAPHYVAEEPCGGGVEVSEWATHDRHRGLRIRPEAAGDEILDRFGLHPMLGVEPDLARDFAPDDYVLREGNLRTAAEERDLAAGLDAGTQLKGRLSAHLLARGGWDLFLSVAGESHAVGHQQWHLHDPAHPRHDAALARALGDPLATVYRRLDESLAEHLAAAGDDALVLVVLSHGMGPHYDGSHLLTEVARRLDAVRGGAPLRDGVPARAYPSEADRRRQRFFRTPNNDHIGALRLNLRGREPDGIVAPGREADEEMEWLRAELLALVNADTGRPAVRAVERVADHHARADDDSFPDVFVDWDHSAPTTTVSSPSIGTVHLPYTHWRTGDHRPHGLLVALGPGVGGGGDAPAVASVDIAPTVAALLGVDPGDVDGSPIPWLATPVAAV